MERIRREARDETRLRAEAALREWAAAVARRNELVRAAWRAGVSKHRIHVLSGIARTTIDRILSKTTKEGKCS